jgi:hypothetical protein
MRHAVACSIRRGIALVTLLAYVSSCTEWHPLPGPQPARRLMGEHDLLLTLRDSTRITLLSARVSGDSLVGRTGSRYHPVRRAVALQEVHTLADRQYNDGMTAAAALSIMGGLLLGVYVGLAFEMGPTFQLACQPAGCPR